jgi:hypothetical protein
VEQQRLMSSRPYELAIFGATPLAGLLAGLLATTHRKRVVLIADAPSPFRLPTGFDLSVAPITRPETWALLKAGTTETLHLLRQIGGHHATRYVDPLFVAETVAGNAALSHVRTMAMGFAFAVERTPHAAGQFGVRIRDAVLLDRPALAPLLSAWLGRIGVERVETRRAKAAFGRDGSVRIDRLGQTIEAAHAVLADDEAILMQLDTALNDGSLAQQQATVTLTAPTRRLAAPLVVHLDGGVTLVEAFGGQVLAYIIQRPGEAANPLVGALATQGPLRRVAQRQLRVVVPPDGAPLVGPLRGGKATVVAGFGPSGAFLAPALARYLTGTSSTTENAYFAARQTGARANVADYSAPAALGVVA